METDHSTDFVTQSRVSVESSNDKVENKFNTVHYHNFNEEPIYATEFLSDDAFAAFGCNDGAIRVMSSSKGDVQYLLKSEDRSPISSLSANPNSSEIKNSVMATHTQGTVQFWHATSQQLLFSKKFDEFLHASTISSDGKWYVFAGDQGHLKIGHLNKGSPTDLETGHIGAHDNRVFCLKWNPYDPNQFFSGGWDRTVFFWDVRTKTAINKIYGCYIGGKAIDVYQKEVVLGNNLPEYPLRIYDMTADKMRTVEWKLYTQASVRSNTGVLACQFGVQKDTEIIAASAHRELRLYNGERCSSIFQHKEPNAKIYSFAHMADKKKIATSWSNGDMYFLQY